ncbi:hypothetical protein AR679_gp030 [Yellowstone lake phycodnavirus 1]|uniref:hypothetical protein n=1 Tax=Yellowstone lake phycodnavirus 1 TaxID=1586713 RepID=UPI0006EB8F8F|nr:hypothetical protein AR679_gp030 [Yellowstone lake phycodnavirus 1]BAT22056.1 hypothetical protein [Yellowstone lake phycodnavirus 1]
MMRMYITHCPFSCSERRPVLEKHLEERGFTDVVWFTKYAKNHPFIEWLYYKFDKCGTLECISGCIKYYECILAFLEDEAAGDRAIFCTDDVVFIDGAKDAINSLENYPFVNLSIGVLFGLPPGFEVFENDTWNNGGAEASVMTRDYCKFLINNFDMRAGIDHIFAAPLYASKLKLYVLPIAHQTSILAKVLTANDPSSIDGWKYFMLGYKPTGISYLDLWKESGLPREDKMDEYKQLVEQDFYKTFNQRIDIKNSNYILLRASAILSKTEGGG